MNNALVKVIYSSSVFIPILIGSIMVDSYPRISKLLRIMGFTAPPLLFILTGYIRLLDYQLVLTLVTVIAALGISLHSEAYYRVLYGTSRFFQISIDVILASLLLLYSSTYFIELIIYWFILDIFIALVAITMEYGAENLPVASTYIALCIAPSDIALLTMWALLASSYGLDYSIFINLNTIPQTPLNLDYITSLIITVGFAAKIGQIPFHSWIPIVYGKSPTHVSAILSGVVSKMGIYALFLSMQLFNTNSIALYVLFAQGLISTVYGSFGAVLQVNVKNLLAYSSIGYYGIMASLFAAFTLLSQPILKAALLVTLVFHTVIKVLAFLNTSLVYQVSNTYDVYRLGYLYYVTRKGALSAFTALLSLTGIPPSIGFTVKLLLLLASINLSLIHTLGIPLLVAIVLSSVFSIAYGAKFMGIYLSSIPRITPRPIPIPQLELNAEIYLGVASLILPLSILLYTYYAGFLDIVFAVVLIAIYAITFTAYTLLFTRIYTKPDIPEDVKYWLSGVES